MQTIIVKQKEERDALLSEPYIPREKEKELTLLLDSHPIKIITGPRRAGKSMLAINALKGRNFAYLNFDSEDLLQHFDQYTILDVLDLVYPGYEYLLLDEIQNLPTWNDWLGKLYRLGKNLIVTGSNANLLSTEMESKLTGRYVSIEVLPFSFAEYLKIHTDGSMLDTAEEYLSLGGYPEIVNDPNAAKSYLPNLFNSILYKDVVRRYNVRKTTELNNLAKLLVSRYGGETTYYSLAIDLGLSSFVTARKFTEYLESAYLCRLLPRFNYKQTIMQKAPRKTYVIDNGMITANAFDNGENKGHKLENAVFLELVRRGYVPEISLFYYRTKNTDKEIDFVCKKGAFVNELIQVCYDMTLRSTYIREESALETASKELGCDKKTIIVWNNSRDDFPNDKGIRIKRFCDWALEK